MLQQGNIWGRVIYIFYMKSYKSLDKDISKRCRFGFQYMQGYMTLILWGSGRLTAFYFVFRILLFGYVNKSDVQCVLGAETDPML